MIKRQKQQHHRGDRAESIPGKHIVLKGSNQFRIRLVCSVLSLRPVVMTEIRQDEEEPGLNEAEFCFVRMLAKLCNGSRLVINETGTRITFEPGMLTGGKIAVEDIDPTVDLGWLVEGLLPLTPFFKTPLMLTLTGGLTDSNQELGINYLRNVSLKLLQKFTGEAATLECINRGFAPAGGGSITLFAPTVRKHLIVPTDLIGNLKVLKIRGIAQASRVNPQLANRLASSSRAVLEKFAPDVFVNTDCRSSRTKDGGRSPGYSLTLWADVINPHVLKEKHGDLIQAVSVLGVSGSYDLMTRDSPEDLAQKVSQQLLFQVGNRGAVSQQDQTLLIVLMALCPEVVVRANVGKELGTHAIHALRVVKQFLGVKFHISSLKQGEDEEELVEISCLGNGVGNIARTVT